MTDTVTIHNVDLALLEQQKQTLNDIFLLMAKKGDVKVVEDLEGIRHLLESVSDAAHPYLNPDRKLFNVALNSGRHVQIMVNKKTGLMVVDVVNAEETGGNEIVRRDLNAVDMSHVKEVADG